MGLTVGKERWKRREGALDALTLHKVWSFIAQFVNDIQVYSGTLIARSLYKITLHYDIVSQYNVLSHKASIACSTNSLALFPSLPTSQLLINGRIHK